MANKYGIQVLRDTVPDSVIKLTASFDGSGQEANNSRIVANSLYGALDANTVPLRSSLSVSNTPLGYYDLQVTGVKYFVNFGLGTGTVELFWNGGGSTPAAQYANSATIMHVNMQGEYGMGEQIPSIPNNSGNTAIGNTSIGNGDIGVYSNGAAANCSYTLIISLRKNNQMYQRGQFNDPAAFNFGQYAMRP